MFKSNPEFFQIFWKPRIIKFELNKKDSVFLEGLKMDTLFVAILLQL